MIERSALLKVHNALGRQAAVALIGPRQIGKTTLALDLAGERDSIYLDLEARAEREKLVNPSLFFSRNEDKLIVLDEIHRVPELFQELRGIIDQGRRKGLRTGRFLMLGSASLDLLRQSGETLAGRIEYINMQSINLLEAINSGESDQVKLWVRGGFPDSFTASSDHDSNIYRENYIRTYLERDVPQFGPRIPAETLERLWRMLAHNQGQMLNASSLAASLSISAPTVSSYIDLLVDLLLVRRLQPYHINTQKRLVKSPRIYIRDSGLAHTLLGIGNYNQLAGHPAYGASWESFVIENLLSVVPEMTVPSFYRTSAGAEIDLILEMPRGEIWTVEIKSGMAPKLEKGFYHSLDDIRPHKSFVVYAGSDRYPITETTDAISLSGMMKELQAFGG